MNYLALNEFLWVIECEIKKIFVILQREKKKK